jgi:ferric-dicitrate binding protein FerR (iron transport regulator)
MMNDFFNRYLSNKSSEKDFNDFLDLFLKEEKENELEHRMYLDWQNRPYTDIAPDLTPVLHEIHYEINKTDKYITEKKSIFGYLSKIAAILILPLAFALFYQWRSFSSEGGFTQTVSTPLASRTNFTLPDGSKVWLNAGSTISFSNRFGKKTRVVRLTGQAYFDVKKGKVPFSVETKNFSVNVLGTAFDVFAYPGENAEVTLERGKVQIETTTNVTTDLTPGQQATINKSDGQIEKRSIDSKAFVAWKDNRLTFENEPLEKVVLCLERWFNVTINIEDASIRNLKVNGTIEYESINEVLDLLQITAPINCTYDKDKQIFKIKAK